MRKKGNLSHIINSNQLLESPLQAVLHILKVQYFQWDGEAWGIMMIGYGLHDSLCLSYFFYAHPPASSTK